MVTSLAVAGQGGNICPDGPMRLEGGGREGTAGKEQVLEGLLPDCLAARLADQGGEVPSTQQDKMMSPFLSMENSTMGP